MLGPCSQGNGLLNSELPALTTLCCQAKSRYSFRTGLTASTRNRDVFPAFCSPIMVMSISVALPIDIQLMDFRTRSFARTLWVLRWLCKPVREQHFQDQGLDSMKYVPEQPQQPVIDTPEEAGHGQSLTWRYSKWTSFFHGQPVVATFEGKT